MRWRWIYRGHDRNYPSEMERCDDGKTSLVFSLRKMNHTIRSNVNYLITDRLAHSSAGGTALKAKEGIIWTFLPAIWCFICQMTFINVNVNVTLALRCWLVLISSCPATSLAFDIQEQGQCARRGHCSSSCWSDLRAWKMAVVFMSSSLCTQWGR